MLSSELSCGQLAAALATPGCTVPVNAVAAVLNAAWFPLQYVVPPVTVVWFGGNDAAVKKLETHVVNSRMLVLAGALMSVAISATLAAVRLVAAVKAVGN